MGRLSSRMKGRILDCVRGGTEKKVDKGESENGERLATGRGRGSEQMRMWLAGVGLAG
jgi:hypothetical protein